jgi:asparagine synthetase B (glutamine-hydrolysing)
MSVIKVFGSVGDRMTGQIRKDYLAAMGEVLRYPRNRYNQLTSPGMGTGYVTMNDSRNTSKIFADKSIQVIVCGYLLNADAEEISQKYKDRNFLRTLNGVFNIIIMDRNESSLTIINDRCGMRPMYYTIQDNRLVFGSEIKSIVADKTVERRIEWEFWKNHFAIGFQLGYLTPFKGILSMENATILTFRNGKAIKTKYWDYDEIKVDHEHDEEFFIKEGAEVIKEGMIRQSKGMKNACVLLSGGYDSRCIAAVLARFTKVKFTTFTSSSHPSGDKDVIYARQVSKKLGVENITISRENWHIEKDFSKTMEALDYMCNDHTWLFTLVDQLGGYSTNMDGIAGDITLRGSRLSESNVKYVHDNNRLARVMFKDMILVYNKVGYDKIYNLFRDDMVPSIRFKADDIRKELDTIPDCENKHTIFISNSRTKSAVSLMSANILARSVFSRSPFYDNEIIEFSLSIPPEMKLHNHIYKRILERLFSDIMEIPSTNDKGTINKRWKQAQRYIDMIPNEKVVYNIIKIKDTIYKRFYTKVNMDRAGYLIRNFEEINLPPFLDRKKILISLKRDIENRIDPEVYGIPLLQFCQWHNQYLAGNEEA